MSKDSRHDGRRRGAGQHRLGPRIGQGVDGRERSGSNSSGSSHGGGKSRNTPIPVALKRSNSQDKVRRIVAEEGRAARNLIAWSVPLENKEEEGKSKTHTNTNLRNQRINAGLHRNKKQNLGLDSKSTTGAMLDKAVDKSPTKARQPRKVDLRARYWAFLFDNLRRAVDEIYVTCESDQSVVECKEVLMMLDNYVRDFKALIDWIQLQEKLENTDAQNRPTSLAWEVRKMSPGRHVKPSPSSDRIIPSPSARRTLNFGGPSHTGPSWADRVKSSQNLPAPSQANMGPVEKSGKKDAEGWETVQRGRPARSRSAAIVAKVIPVLAHVTSKDTNMENKQLPGRACHVDQEDHCERPIPEEFVEDRTSDSGKSPLMEPPADSVPGSGHCVEAQSEDTPLPLPVPTFTQAPAPHLTLPAPDPTISSAPNLTPSAPDSTTSAPDSTTSSAPELTPSSTDPTSSSAPNVTPSSPDLTPSLAPNLTLTAPDSTPSLAPNLSLPTPDSTHSSVPNLGDHSLAIPPSLDQAQADGPIAFGDQGAAGGVSQGMATSAPGQAETPMAAVKLEIVLDPTELSTPQSMAEVLAKKEELADRLEKANEEAIASAIAEEEQLTREIQAENNELETDNMSDFSTSIGSGVGLNLDWSDMLADYDAREPWRQSTSWGDIVEEEPSRPPGHGIHMHEKLSSPSRKRTIAESKKKHEEKQLKAQQLRDKLRDEKTHKLQKLLEREKEVRKWKEELLDQRRKMMDEKLLHAEFKRELQLQAIVKKAQEEEAKVNEIAFINTLEAQNKRHDVLAKLNEYEQRLNELQEERGRRQEEKQARDEAVQERKRALEAERQARVEELLVKRKEQEARIEQQKQEKERAREDAARERARDREERLAALSAAQQEAMEELQKKIQMKITTEVHLYSHTKGRRHQQAVREGSSIQGRELSDEEVEHLSLKKYILDIVTDSTVSSENGKDGEERQKARKKAKKLRGRMNSRAKEYETSMEGKTQVPDSTYKAKLQRLVKDLLKQLQGQDSGQWANTRVSGLDRTLGEISRILEKQNNADQVAFQLGGGLSALELILQVVTTASSPTAVPRIPLKSLCAAVNTYYLACCHCQLNCSYVLFSNRIAFLMDLLLHQLTLFVPDEDKSIFGRGVNKQVFDGLTTALLQTSATVLSLLRPHVPDGERGDRILSPDSKGKTSPLEPFNSRAQDLISYVVNMGLIDKLYSCFLSVQGPVDESPKMSAFLQQATAVLHALCTLCFAVTSRSPSIFDNKRSDPTGLTCLLQSTDLVGVVHTLYCILLHSASLPEAPAQSPQEPYAPGVIQVALHGLRFLNSFALLDLSAFQSVLGAEGLSLAFRHIVSSLLWYCSQHTSEHLLHEVIICVGYFTVNHPDNQVIVQSGRQPSVLQKLCQLPFQVILQQEMSCVLLATFIQDCASSENQPDHRTQEGDKVSQPLDYSELSNRFPRDQWESALQFFLKKQEE
ncbi:hypothetical protein UPYG_G00264830 [Umbra pygmaea]|uniref:S phase cyclin A-associated protein in the endoplasmic reticulum N-terminal domain-containing protein n=1 Tax=Umbra pygmaea TaxID=75934 RepID=A0ABD0WES0_UMBPY